MPNARSGSEERSVLLTVSSDLNDIRTLQAFLDEWTVRGVQTCAEALGALRRGSCSIVLCEKELADGSWQDLLSGMRGLTQATPLIVMSRLADETLWADVLREGGFDVLAKPLEKTEVHRVFSGAARWTSRGKAFAQAS
jgi:DNA-binding NtrC family response regulator